MSFAVEREEDIIPDVIHPVVVRHPETGRDAIFISETFTNGIVGMTRDEGRELTMLIQNHVTRPEFRVEVAYERAAAFGLRPLRAARTHRRRASGTHSHVNAARLGDPLSRECRSSTRVEETLLRLDARRGNARAT